MAKLETKPGSLEPLGSILSVVFNFLNVYVKQTLSGIILHNYW